MLGVATTPPIRPDQGDTPFRLILDPDRNKGPRMKLPGRRRAGAAILPGMTDVVLRWKGMQEADLGGDRAPRSTFQSGPQFCLFFPILIASPEIRLDTFLLRPNA